DLTIDFLEELDIVYPDGNIGFASADRFDDRLERLCKLLQPYSDAIRKGYPKVSKNSCGYRLDAVITGNKFQPHKVFAASEGTLGIVTSAKMRILDIPEHRSILVLAFKNLVDAVSAVPAILKKFSPAALEMLDHTVVSHGGKMHNNYSGAGCLLFVEFARTDSSSRNVDEDQMSHCRQELAGRCSVVEYASDEESITRIWSARKAALNNVMKITVGSRKPMGLIEDTVVDPVFLPDHVTEILRAYKENNLDYVVYGHVGDGNLHTRPIIDFSSKSQIEMMERIAADVFTRVIKVGGTITGEHGDGIARVKYIEMVYGRELCCLFADVKRLFDPNFTINPGKKVLVR
ncbi:MAG TPA: FAD-linked oxidase C-terminal domain-containing protein, partial [Nitrososphaera sp.]|nr:FAD-linked oxidase C-terminal domain-containing protein [Nitrososphaera sp.]